MRARYLLLGLVLGVLAAPGWVVEAAGLHKSHHDEGGQSAQHNGHGKSHHASQSTHRSISVQGLGVVSARPDVAIIEASVTSQSAKAKAALDQHNGAMAKLLAELKAFGLAPRDVQTRQVNLRAIYPNRRQQEGVPVPSAFRAMGNVRIRLREVDRLGDLLDRMTAAGVNKLSGPHFTIADPAPLQNKARKLAIRDARRRAQLYAAEAGVNLDDVLRIREGTAASPIRGFLARSASTEQSPIAAGENEIRVGVTVLFAIK